MNGRRCHSMCYYFVIIGSTYMTSARSNAHGQAISELQSCYCRNSIHPGKKIKKYQ